MNKYFFFILVGLVSLYLFSCRSGAPAQQIACLSPPPIYQSFLKSLYQFKKSISDSGQFDLAIHLIPNKNSHPFFYSAEKIKDSKTDLIFISALELAPYCPRLQLLLLPWLFRSLSLADSLFEGPLSNAFLEELGSLGLQGLAWGTLGYKQLAFSSPPPKTIEEFSGITFEIPSVRLVTELFRLLNVNTIVDERRFPTTPTPPSGHVAILSNLYDYVYYNQSSRFPYLLIWNCFSEPVIMCIKKAPWQALNKQQQKYFMTAAQQAMKIQREEAARDLVDLQIKLKKRKTFLLDHFQPEEFISRSKILYDAYRKKINPSLMDLMMTALSTYQVNQVRNQGKE